MAKGMIFDGSGVHCMWCGEELSGEWLDGLDIDDDGCHTECPECDGPITVYAGISDYRLGDLAEEA